MKILQLGKFYPVRGGVEKVMYDLMIGVSEEGIDCDMLCAAEHGNFEISVNNHARLIGVRSLMKIEATMIAPAMICKLHRLCAQYDIIHIHHPDPMAALALYFSGYRGEVILHWHSDIISQKHLLKYYRPLQRWLIRRSNLILGTSPIYLKGSPFLADVQDKTACLPIGVKRNEADEHLVEQIKRKYLHKKIIFSLGRLVAYKGYEYLIDAARYLDDGYHIIIGGSGPLKVQLQKQINERNLNDKVELIGYMDDASVTAHFEACDLFCLSSIYKTEAFGIVQIEAMSHGKPVVATRIPESGVSWVNADHISGINITPGNDRELAAAFINILSDANTYELYATQAYARYLTMFTQTKMILNYMKICQKIKL